MYCFTSPSLFLFLFSSSSSPSSPPWPNHAHIITQIVGVVIHVKKFCSQITAEKGAQTPSDLHFDTKGPSTCSTMTIATGDWERGQRALNSARLTNCCQRKEGQVGGGTFYNTQRRYFSQRHFALSIEVLTGGAQLYKASL